LSSKYCILVNWYFMSLLYKIICIMLHRHIILGLIINTVVHFYIDFNSWQFFLSKHFCYFYLQCSLFPHTHGFCNPVRIHRMRINDIISGGAHWMYLGLCMMSLVERGCNPCLILEILLSFSVVLTSKIWSWVQYYCSQIKATAHYTHTPHHGHSCSANLLK
jgi:hypothetical protein